MKWFQAIPHPALASYIDRFWGWESEPDEIIRLPTLLPGTGAEIFFHYRTPFVVKSANRPDENLGASHLVCTRQRPAQLHAKSDIGFIAARLRVGCLPRFIATPASELFDQYPSAADLWPGAGSKLVEQVKNAPSPATRLQLIETFFCAALDSSRTDLMAEAAALRIYANCATETIDQTALGLGIGRRQMERRVKRLTGHKPVDIRSLSRLQKTVRAMALRPDLSVIDAALAQGYYDQSHFIRVFGNLGCGSPQRFRETGGLVTHFYNTPRQSESRVQTTLQ